MRHKKLYIILSVLLGLILLDEVRWSYEQIRFYIKISEFQLQWIVQKSMLLVGLVALALFISSKFRNTALLRFYCCYVILAFPLSLLFYKMIFSRAEFDSYITFNFWSWLGVSIELVLTGCCCVLLWFLTKERVPRLKYTLLGNESFAEFSPASRWKRFLHYMVDTAFMMYFCFEWVKTLMLWPGSHRKELAGLAEHAWLFAFTVFLCYYFVFEVLFKTTAGKCLSSTVLANEQGKRPSFGELLGRTFCRLIPFDPLSFFARSRRGWHDTISDTYVTDSVREDEQQPEEPEAGDLLSAYEAGLQT